MESIKFFDAACGVGPTMYGEAQGVKELLEDMDRYGVDRALVRLNSLGQDGAVVANEKLLEMVSSPEAQGRLECVWCILPTQCPELPAPEAFFALLGEVGVRAITLDPFSHRYVPSRISIGKFLDEAEKRRVPVMLNSFAGKWNELYDFMKEFPGLQCVINGGNKWGNDRYIRPLLEAYPGLSVELAGYWVPEGIYDLAKAYGASRLLYGSGFPGYNHGAEMLQLKHSGLELEEIKKIAGENLEALLAGGVR